MAITHANSTVSRFVQRNWPLLIPAGLAIIVIYYGIMFVTWVFTESPEHRTHREYWEHYNAWHDDLAKHVALCAKKNGTHHFGPMIGFVPAGTGGCGMGGRSNGIACTWNNSFQDDLKVLWDEARARGACVVWDATIVTWRGSDKMFSGVAAYADDNVGKRISIAFKEKKMPK